MEALSHHNSANQIWGAFAFRDSSSDFLFERDTMFLGVNSNFEIRGMMAASGSFPGSVTRNHWKDCFVKINGYILGQDRIDNTLIENCVFASKNGNIFTFSRFNNSVLRHNTFFSGRQTMSFETISGSGNEITSNIFYSQNAGGPGAGGGTVFFNTNARTGFRGDNNLFFTPTFTNRVADRSIVWCCYSGSAPGSGTSWNALAGNDAHSRYGSPLFADSSFAHLDARLRPGSLAMGVGEGGTDAGARPFIGGTDTTPPGAIADLGVLEVGDRTILLGWTATGDDGAVGTAGSYDLRWSLSPISAANFASATPLTPGPIPLPSGDAQTYVVTDRTPGATYYFAIRAIDIEGNVGAISNVLQISTLTVDGIRPAGVDDLSTP
jgi:hypothetical protein